MINKLINKLIINKCVFINRINFIPTLKFNQILFVFVFILGFFFYLYFFNIEIAFANEEDSDYEIPLTWSFFFFKFVCKCISITLNATIYMPVNFFIYNSDIISYIIYNYFLSDSVSNTMVYDSVTDTDVNYETFKENGRIIVLTGVVIGVVIVIITHVVGN